MNDAKKFQDQLIANAREAYAENPLSPSVIDAFYAVPRHEFVQRFDNLAVVYADHPLVIYGEERDFVAPEGDRRVSTISQPSFVLRMLDLLELKKGHRVFEVGTGSGWNAALMGYLVGTTGKVVSIEIISDLVKPARAAVEKLGLSRVEIIEGDGAEGCVTYAPYDRAIFTAGAYDLPKAFHEQIKEGGLLLFVLKDRRGPDILLLLKKRYDHFESQRSMLCGFVSMTGKSQMNSKDVDALDSASSAPDMPPLSELNVKIFPIDANISAGTNQWLIRRKASQFLWSLPP